MRRAFFFIVAIVFAANSFASIPRASMLDRASEDAPAFVASLPETRIRVSEVLAPFERPAESELTRALRQAYEHPSTTNASGLRCFLSVDPVLPIQAALKSPQMWNRYAYVRNNPINATDPDGRCEICLDNALGREQLAVVNGQMTMDQYLDIQAARFNGAMTGYSIVEGVGAVRSLVGLFTRGGAETLFANAAKREVLQSLREGAGAMSSEQRATVIRQVQRATTKESVSVVQNSNGTIQVLRSRPGRDGAQTFVTTVLKDGTEKTVQTAANAAGQTTHYDPKNAKTIWDTVKSWWYR